MTELDQVMMSMDITYQQIAEHKESGQCTGDDCEVCSAFERVLASFEEELKMEVDPRGGDTCMDF